MKNLRRFAEWVTKLKNRLQNKSEQNVFLRARIILTLYYILVVTLVMGIFSGLLYFALVGNIKESLKDQFYDEIIEQEVYTQTIDRVNDIMIWSDLSALVVVAGLGYFLAKRTLQPIQKTLDDQKRFSADASHELRTPLSVMQSEAEIILRDKDARTENYKKVLGSSLEEIGRMRKIIENLLLVARGSEKTNTGKFSEINLSLIIEEIVKKMEPMAKIKNLKWGGVVEPDLYILGNAYFMEHALSNIVQNAIEYTDQGEIAVRAFKKDGENFVEVADTGIGISEKDLPNVLKRFYKASALPLDKKSGAGLGLSIANEIITRHQGEIKIDSKLGQGTAVKINLTALK